MPRRAPGVQDDPELLELFGDNPTGLAVADAVIATQRRRHPRVRTSLAAVLVVAVLVTVFAAFLLAGPSRAGVIERALHRFDTARIVHLVLVDQRVSADLMDATSGKLTPVRHVINEWYDPSTHQLRVRDSVAGTIVSDNVARGRATAVEISSFPRLYRRALANGTASVAGHGSEAGQRVVWITFPFNSRSHARVALNEASLDPVTIKLGTGRSAARFTVRSIDHLQQKGSSLVPRPGASIERSTIVSATEVDSAQIADLPYRLAGGLQISSTRLLIWRASGGARGTASDVLYRNKDGRYLRITEATQPLWALGWRSQDIALSARGDEVLRTAPYTVFVRRGHRFITVATSIGRALAIAEARDLHQR